MPKNGDAYVEHALTVLDGAGRVHVQLDAAQLLVGRAPPWH